MEDLSGVVTGGGWEPHRIKTRLIATIRSRAQTTGWKRKDVLLGEGIHLGRHKIPLAEYREEDKHRSPKNRWVLR